MARLIPPYVLPECRSSGERRIFRMFQDDPSTNEWVVLHSLNLSNHVKRLYGEIDFLVLIPGMGTFVIEVKAGDVSYRQGQWHFTNRQGRTNTKAYGPFEQAMDAMFSLKAAVVKNFGKGHKVSNTVFGFGVAFTDILFDNPSVEYDQWLVMDKKDMDKPVSHYFKRLARYTTEKLKSQTWFDPVNSVPGTKEVSLLADFLRGDFERIRTLNERLEAFDRDAKFYTDEQFKVLDAVMENPKMLVRGGAGTGKTMIAMESAVRTASTGKTVFLTCFNRLIGSWMAEQMEKWDGITVGHIHQYLLDKTKGYSYDDTGMAKDEFYHSYLPGLVKEMYGQGIFEKFDKIIVDEGQDLIRPAYLDLFDAMLEGGLRNGNCEVYGDFEKQAIYSGLRPQEMYNLLQTRGHFFRYSLKINCRNTKEIGRETARMSGFEHSPFILSVLDGIPVDYRFYNNKKEEADKLADVLRQVSVRGVPAEKVTILSPLKLKNSCAGLMHDIPLDNLGDMNQYISRPGMTGYCTIQAFKGLESHFVILCDVQELSTDEARAMLYVGMSRAKFGLIVLLPKPLENEYHQIISQHFERP